MTPPRGCRRSTSSANAARPAAVGGGSPQAAACRVRTASSAASSTGTNWEGVGVVPDVACDAAEAEEVAARRLGGPGPG